MPIPAGILGAGEAVAWLPVGVKKLEADIQLRINKLIELLSKIAPFSKARIEKVKKSLHQKIAEIDTENIDVPEKESEVDLVLPSKNFTELINQFEIFDNTLSLTFTEEEIIMKASGDDGSMSTTMKLEDVSEYAIGEGEEVKQSFALRYIKMMAAFGKLANEVSMEFGESQPLRLKYTLSIDNEDSYIRFFLAPKISDDWSKVC